MDEIRKQNKIVDPAVNAVAIKINKPKDDKSDKKEKMTGLIQELIKQHLKALEKLS